LGLTVVKLQLLRHQPTLTGARVRLEPMGPQHFDGLWPMFADDELRAGSRTLHEFTREQIRTGMAKARERHDRADWVIVRVEDDAVLGEAVLMDLDEDNESMAYRISLIGPEVYGHGYGTETTRLVRDFALGPLALHRLALEVNSFNEAAIAVYTKAGFVREGVRREAVRRGRTWFDVHDMAIIATDPRP
jgi:RimJ/RimL family protein N-acetyltransferase